MKFTFLKSIVLGIFAVLLFSCHSNNETAPVAKKFSENNQYPLEWMYNQRAYPDNYINKQAMVDAIAQTKSILAARNIAGGDWEFVGPLNTGGRVTDVAISPDSDDVLFVGTAVGGVFKTTDGGENWTPIFDDIGKASIGNIAIAPSNSQRIYVGTGEANGSATSGAFFGDGVYRSDDGGTSWQHTGLEDSDHIGRIVVDPTDEDRAFVAATGTLYGYNNERGIYRTTNAGTDWEQVLFVTDSTAAIDVAMNPVDTDILFAATWERTRKPWQRDYGGLTSGVYRSLDGGDTWVELGASNGLPAPDAQTGRIGLAVSESSPSTVYARYTTNEITNVFNGLYKSTDNGDNWTLVTLGELSTIDASFGWFFGNVRVNPEDADEVFVLGQRIFRTSNSGTSWQEINGMHVDHHALEYSKNNNNFLLAGNDGGAYTSTNGGTTWTKFTNLPITQFYNIDVDNIQPNNVYGGTQDNNTIRTQSGGATDWNAVWGGDGFHVNIDPVDNNFIYVESQYGNLGRSTNGGNTFDNATAGIDFGADRNNWNTPVIISPFNTEKVYYGTNRLYISDRAAFWNPISPDLTDGAHPSGSLSYGTLTAIAPSYNNLNVIYTGSDDGNVNITLDGGTTWNSISAGLPDRYVTSIAISPSDDATAYVTFSGFGLLDQTPHVFKTINSGQSWVDISSNLPDIPVNDIIINEQDGLLLIATDVGVWYSHTDGAVWTVLGDNLPLTVMRDIKLHKPTNTLYVGTFGRSIHKYSLDNLILGIDDVTAASQDFSIYPNPSNDAFMIQGITSEDEVTVNLYGITGIIAKRLFQGNAQMVASQRFSVADLVSGVYFVTVKTGNQTTTKKLLVN
ncbi:T9SS type A sorting domain-containing protein [Rasiella rasia]|uniref:T9SS type A sorting domain-containing protein n=1 Tax=Rasiella rasia TaxID=2744027 RepID=A0A6G6GJR0_9FLAO|nr:T9SS type A sorting domain-containing protein [Rasiella rasia]QIE58826.1 T9SS type A sorting domain-containing protein [Rasiella rasia]